MELCIEQVTASQWETSWEQAGLPGLELPTFERLEAPGDLGSWVAPATILGWVAHEVEMGDGTTFQPADGAQQFPPYERKLMFCVLAYAYTRQMFDAEEIARSCARDPVLRRLWDGGAPFPSDLQRFRRSNRAALERIVTGVFEKAIRHRFDLGRMVLPPELEGDLQQLAAERLDIARHVAAED